MTPLSASALQLTAFAYLFTSAVGASDRSVVIIKPDDLHHLWEDAPATPFSVSTASPDLAPNINRLRTEGVTFTRAYVAGPKCAPSRFNTMTGRYCSTGEFAQARARGNDRTVVQVPQCKLDGSDLINSLPNQLSTQGQYRTIVAGKWHIAAGLGDPWDSYEAVTSAVSQAGVTDPVGIYATNIDTSRVDFTHNMEWVTAEANTAVTSAVQANENFFLYFAPTIPHGPSVLDALTDGNILATPSGTLSEIPNHGMAHSREEILSMTAGSRQQTAECGVIWLDDAVGSVLANLEAHGILDTTLVIFLQDHGQAAKDTLYEGGARVAMMARLPGVFGAGISVSTAVSNVDLAPTVFDYTGVAPTVNYNTDGLSWLAAATTSPDTTNDINQRACVVSEINIDRAVICRGLGFKLISHQTGEVSNRMLNYPASSSSVQIYNLNEDPVEQNNLAGNADIADIEIFLTAYLACHLSRTHPTTPSECHPEDIPAPNGVTASPTITPPTTTVQPSAAPTPPPTRQDRTMGNMGGMGGMGGRRERRFVVRGREVQV